VATRKQRRRREKERRHEYEIVYVDQEGQEVEVDEEVAKPKKEPQSKSAQSKSAQSKPSGQKPKPGAKSASTKTSSRPERVVEPPTWTRTFRRAAIFVPIMLIFLYFARPKNVSTTAIVFQAVVVVVMLVLFMYAMDSLLYRSYQKRLAKRDGSPPKPK
jgi:hypothetical protein